MIYVRQSAYEDRLAHARACAGEMVDVRSIAAYICQPKQADFEARVRRSGRVWAV